MMKIASPVASKFSPLGRTLLGGMMSRPPCPLSALRLTVILTNGFVSEPVAWQIVIFSSGAATAVGATPSESNPRIPKAANIRRICASPFIWKWYWQPRGTPKTEVD